MNTANKFEKARAANPAAYRAVQLLPVEAQAELAEALRGVKAP
jgi:hypothetical protein